MKPTEHKTPLERELIAHIRESLVEHEESYQLGAWEKFNAPEKKRRPFFVPFLQGAAAILIIGLITFLIVNKKSNSLDTVTSNIKTEQTEIEQNPLENVIKIEQKPIISKSTITSNDDPKEQTLKNQNSRISSSNQSLTIAQNQTVLGTQETVAATNLPVQKQAVNTNKVEIIEPYKPVEKHVENVLSNPTQESVTVTKVETQKTNIIDFLESETKNNIAKKEKEKTDKNNNRFTLGLVVAPSFGNVKRLNMGYGVSVDYQLSDKFALNSGLAYNQMAAAKGVINNGQSDMASVSAIAKSSSTKSLESIEERVTGIDIPLEIKYNVSKNLYANVGVSAFAVINQKRNNTFLEERIVQQSAGLSSANSFSSVLVTQRVTENQTVTETQDYSYLGFYNLSFGYKKKISKNNSFAIEPFLKLPMREVKTENLRLIGTGVKLKFDF
ncbi:porin family protein [Pedobacter cryotolerans]|uniref:PorT family protein n=1 Tax=Pedobacter cryotolerans TaxID=2571270 RepID=A0A4V5NYB9_9SPHI|nr:outer membrane beta-barrel protein [Pedobacter cryotolerans]TKC03154.1 PorT family protein [Pedobacter cryotolerans]